MSVSLSRDAATPLLYSTIYEEVSEHPGEKNANTPFFPSQNNEKNELRFMRFIFRIFRFFWQRYFQKKKVENEKDFEVLADEKVSLFTATRVAKNNVFYSHPGDK